MIIAWTIAIFWLSIYACSPVYAFWTFALLPKAKCINTIHFHVGVWVPNITTDLIILFFPQIRIWKLQVSFRARLGLAFMFLLGSLYVDLFLRYRRERLSNSQSTVALIPTANPPEKRHGRKCDTLYHHLPTRLQRRYMYDAPPLFLLEFPH